MAPSQPQLYLDTTLDALGRGGDWRSALNQLPVPVYTVAPDGAVTYWNDACVDFAGREPELGSDHWCVTWQLYTTEGVALPHDQCPMAVAVRKQKEVRGEVAIAMRPDGTRRAFRAYPTPLFGDAGDLTGAVNMLIDITEEQSERLTDQAMRCRRLARATLDAQASQILGTMASSYDETAASLRAPA